MQEMELYRLSLQNRLEDNYDAEKTVVDCALKTTLSKKTFEYFKERRAWHNAPDLEKYEPRLPLHLPRGKPVSQNTLDLLCFVTAAHSGYFDLLYELLESIEGTLSYKHTSVFIFDMGLSDAQKNNLHERFKNIQEIKVPVIDAAGVPSDSRFRAYMAKCAIYKNFPGFRYYLWLDCDTWVQDERALDQYIYLCEEQGLGCSEEWMDTRPFNGLQFKYANPGYFYNQRCFLDKDYFDPYLKQTPYFNTGCFCIDAQTDIFDRFFQKMVDLKNAGRQAWDEPILQAVYCEKRLEKVLDASHMLIVGVCRDIDPNSIQIDDRNYLYLNSGGIRSIAGVIHFVKVHRIGHDGSLTFNQMLPELDTLKPKRAYIRYRTFPRNNKDHIKQLMREEGIL